MKREGEINRNVKSRDTINHGKNSFITAKSDIKTSRYKGKNQLGKSLLPFIYSSCVESHLQAETQAKIM